MGLGLAAKDIVDFYQQHGPAIFPSTSLVQRTRGLLRQLFRPKHSHDVLKGALSQVLGERLFGEAKCRVVVTTYDANAGRIFLLKTAHHERFKFDYQAPAVDVALATSAAPTYFKSAPFPNHANASYVDGGVWANCPALVGLVEAVSFLHIPLDRIDILSIGTTSEPFNIARHATSGVAKWNKGLIDLMFHAQVEAARAQASLLAGGRLHRIDHVGPPGEFSLDDARPAKIDRLISLGRGEAVKKENLQVVGDRFLNNDPAAPFVPCYPVSTKAP